jgi:hypothetical protein
MRSLSYKQIAILQTLHKGNPDGTPMDIPQLCGALPYKPSRQALRCSLGFLVERGLVKFGDLTSRNHTARRIVEITVTGRSIMTAGITPATEHVLKRLVKSTPVEMEITDLSDVVLEFND